MEDIKKEINSLVLTVLATVLFGLVEALASGEYQIVGWASIMGLILSVFRAALRPLIPMIAKVGRDVGNHLLSLTKK